MDRREFLEALAIGAAAGLPIAARAALAGDGDALYDVPRFGNVSLLHFTDCHAQLLPVHFREPDVNLGIAGSAGKPPHLVGEAFLKAYGIAPGSREAHAFTYLDFVRAAATYGRLGGFAHLATLVKRLRASRPGALLLDGGDTWQGSGPSLWTRGQDMVDAQKLLGVDLMTGHWEFTYGQDRVKQVVENDFKGSIEFVAQNIATADFGDPVFKPYVIREIGGVPVAIIGQAFPYTPIANPRYLIADWTFGIKERELQKQVDEARTKGAKIVVLLSHNGMDVDLKLAARVNGIDAILGGHTHDAVPAPVRVEERGGNHPGHQCRQQRQSTWACSTSTMAAGASATGAIACCRCSRTCFPRTRRWMRSSRAIALPTKSGSARSLRPPKACSTGAATSTAPSTR